MAKKNIVQSPTLSITPSDNSPEFFDERFNQLIREKGQEVLFEKALVCPCKSPSINQLTTCRNCGGTGWLLIQPTKTRMIIQQINFSEEQKEHNIDLRGTVSITSTPMDEMSYGDRITVVNGQSTFSEVLNLTLDTDENEYWAYTTYNIRRVEYCGLFITGNVKFRNLEFNKDFTFDGTLFIVKEETLRDLGSGPFSITVRYKHPPQYHVVDLRRETMQSYNSKEDGSEELINLPISASGKRSHYVLDSSVLNGNKVLEQDLTVFPGTGCIQDNRLELNFPAKLS